MTKIPDYHSHDEFEIRTRKLEELRQLGVEPYPHHYTPLSNAKELENEYQEKSIGLSEDAAASATPFSRLAGRLILFRSMGKNAFAHIQDETGRIQLMLNRELTTLEGYQPAEELPELNPYKIIEKKIDLGDIVGVEGHLFRTHKGELTLFVKKLTLLTKTLLPLADKYGGLVDKEHLAAEDELRRANLNSSKEALQKDFQGFMEPLFGDLADLLAEAGRRGAWLANYTRGGA